MLLYAFLLWGLPWVFVPHTLDAWDVPKQAAFQLCGWLFVSWGVLVHGIKRPPAVLAIVVALTAYAVFSCAFRFWLPIVSASPNADSVAMNWHIVRPAIHLVLGCLIALVLFTCFQKDPNDAELLRFGVCMSAFLLAAVCLFQRFGVFLFLDAAALTFPISDPSARMIGFMGNKVETASFLAAAFPLFLPDRGLWIFAAVVALAILLSGVSYAIAAGTLSTAWFARARIRALMVPIIATCCGIGCFLLLGDERLPLWQAEFSRWLEHPFLGYELGDFALRESQGSGLLWRSLHSDSLQALFEFGLFGFLFVVAAAILIIRSKSSPWQACLVSMGILSMTSFPWHTTAISLLGLTALSAQASESLGGTLNA